MALLKIFADSNFWPGGGNGQSSARLNRGRGFTIIEMCVALGMFAFIGSLGILTGLREMKSGSFGDDRAAVIAALQRARSLAANSICSGAGCTAGKPHGVHLDPLEKGFVIFQGASFTGRDKEADEIITFGAANVFIDADAPVDLVFENFSAEVLSPAGVEIKDDIGNRALITVNRRGAIDLRIK